MRRADTISLVLKKGDDDDEFERNCCMLYPEDKLKTNWDLFITLILVFTCFVTPFKIAFLDNDSPAWMLTDNMVDIMFFLDILIIFNSPYYNEDFKLIDNRKVIATQYLQGWFFIDLLAIVPFDVFFGGDNLNEIVRITRIGRLYKLVKLTRLIRVLKIFKERSKLVKYVQEFLKIGIGFERLIIFLFSLIVMCHVVSCLWVLTAQLEDADTVTWMTGDFN